MSDLVTPPTAHARAALARRAILRLHTLPTADATPDGVGSGHGDAGAVDDRLLRRELLLHHLEMERQRRRRRSA